METLNLYGLFSLYQQVLSSYLLPEAVDSVSWQNVYEENGQANVEQDNHADHYGVGALEKKGTRDMRSVNY